MKRNTHIEFDANDIRNALLAAAFSGQSEPPPADAGYIFEIEGLGKKGAIGADTKLNLYVRSGDAVVQETSGQE